MTSRTKSLLKYLVAFGLLGLILWKTDLREIGGYLAKISWLNLALALLCVSLAQCMAGLRMRYFFNVSHFPVSRKYAIILYYVGSFYNFLLPGGIGGDAYKVLLAKKRMDMPAKQGIRIMVADRASGLCVMVFIMLAALYRVDVSAHIPYAAFLLAGAALVTLACFLIASKILLKQAARTMLVSLPYAFATQGLWLLIIYNLWQSLGNGRDFVSYVVLYCASGIASLLPVSVGGLGIKEMTYFYGAHWLQAHADTQVDGELGIAISLCVFALSFVSALPGILWLQSVGKAKI